MDYVHSILIRNMATPLFLNESANPKIIKTIINELDSRPMNKSLGRYADSALRSSS